MITEKEMKAFVQLKSGNQHSGTHDGFTNYPTAAVGLVIQSTHRQYVEAQKACDDAFTVCYNTAVLLNRVVKWLKQEYNGFRKLKRRGIDLEMRQIELIDWFDLARHIVDDFYIKQLEAQGLNAYPDWLASDPEGVK